MIKRKMIKKKVKSEPWAGQHCLWGFVIPDSTSFPDRVGWVPFCTGADPNTPKHKKGKYPKSLPMEQASDSVHCHSWQSPDRGGWGSTQCPLALLWFI